MRFSLVFCCLREKYFDYALVLFLLEAYESFIKSDKEKNEIDDEANSAESVENDTENGDKVRDCQEKCLENETVKQNGTSMEQNETSVKQNETSMKQNETSMEQKETSMKQNETNKDKVNCNHVNGESENPIKEVKDDSNKEKVPSKKMEFSTILRKEPVTVDGKIVGFKLVFSDDSKMKMVGKTDKNDTKITENSTGALDLRKGQCNSTDLMEKSKVAVKNLKELTKNVIKPSKTEENVERKTNENAETKPELKVRISRG